MDYFVPKILRHGPILVKKVFRRGSHFKKLVKSVVFEVVKPLEMGPEGEKSVAVGVGFRPWL